MSDVKPALYLGNIILMIAALLLIFFSLLGNITVLHAVKSNKKLQIVANNFVCNLALVDILYSTMAVLLLMLNFLPEMLNNNGLCTSLTVVLQSCAFVSIGTLLGLSLCRYFAVVKPLKVKKWITTNRSLYIIIFIWVVALLFALIPIFGWSASALTTITCSPDNSKDLSYEIFLLVCVDISACFTLFVLYLQIYRGIKAQKHLMAKHIIQVAMKTLSSEMKKRAASKKKEEKQSAMLFVVVTLYIVTWLPVTIIHTCDYISFHHNNETRMLCYTFSFVNGVANPWVYFLMSRNFRRAFKEIYSCNMFRCSCICKNNTIDQDT